MAYMQRSGESAGRAPEAENLLSPRFLDRAHELVAIGITAATFTPGERVVVSGSLARSQQRSLYLLRLDRPADGFWYEQVGQSPRIRAPRG